MWPLRKKAKGPVASDLTRAEIDWIQQQRDALGELAAAVGLGSPDSDAARLECCDRVIRWWHEQPAGARPDPNMIVGSCGVALGDAIGPALGLEWKIVTDAFGTDLALWGAANQVVLSPTHSVAKRFAESRNGCVVELAEQLKAMHAATVAKMAEG
jgi:hypothetical protein